MAHQSLKHQGRAQIYQTAQSVAIVAFAVVNVEHMSTARKLALQAYSGVPSPPPPPPKGWTF